VRQLTAHVAQPRRADGNTRQILDHLGQLREAVAGAVLDRIADERAFERLSLARTALEQRARQRIGDRGRIEARRLGEVEQVGSDVARIAETWC
jgi:hypothetical protein